MLRHQLPVSPPFETCWDVLPEFFAWLEGTAALPALATAPLGAEDEVFRPPVGLLRRRRSRFLVPGDHSLRGRQPPMLSAQSDSVKEMGCPQAARAEDAGANQAPPKAVRLTAR